MHEAGDALQAVFEPVHPLTNAVPDFLSPDEAFNKASHELTDAASGFSVPGFHFRRLPPSSGPHG